MNGKKLVVQIPCLNEQETIQGVIASIPNYIAGIHAIEVIIIDDGSSDKTAEFAKSAGATLVVDHGRRKGLAEAYSTGLETGLFLDADIIVNIDGDGQYDGADIPKLIEPILKNRADVVIGDRQTWLAKEMGLAKRLLQFLGSMVVSRYAGVRVRDAVSGFRAITKEAALSLYLISDFSYTTESLIFYGKNKFRIEEVAVKAFFGTRKSRLARSPAVFVTRQAVTILRSEVMHRPLRLFWGGGMLLAVVGGYPFVRFLIYYLQGGGSGNIQSLIFGAVTLVLSFLLFSLGILADLISINRKLQEKALLAHRKAAYLTDEN